MDNIIKTLREKRKKLCNYRLVFLIFSVVISVTESVKAIDIDSIRDVVESETLHDTLLLEANLILAWELKSIAPKKAMEYAEKAYNLSLEQDRMDIQGRSYSIMGVIQWQLGEFDKAFDFHMKAGIVYSEIEDDIGLARTYGNMGLLFYEQSYYEKALEYYFRALPIYEEKSDSLALAVMYNNIGLVYLRQDDFALSKKYHLLSLEIKKEHNDTRGIAFSYNSLGQVFQGENNADSALFYFNKALELREGMNDFREIAITSGSIGSLHLEYQNYEKAAVYLLRSQTLYNQVNDQSGLAQTYNLLGDLYLGKGDIIRAQNHYTRAVNISKPIKLNRILSESYRGLSHTYSAQGNYSRAFHFQEAFLNLKDSIYNEESRRRLYELQWIFDREQVEKEIELLRKNEQINSLNLQKQRLVRNFLIIGIVLVILMLFLLYNRFLFANKSNKMLEHQKEEISKTNRQLIDLNYELMDQKKMFEELNHQLNQSNRKLKESEKSLIQINATKDKFFSIISHDLRNPFASIVSFSRILKRDIDSLTKEELQDLALELDKSVLKINNLLENLLQWSRTQTGKIKFKPDFFELDEVVDENFYLFLNNAKEKQIKLVNNVEKNLEVFADKNMTDTVVRNLLSNALKYTENEGTIILNSSIREQFVYVSVADNGVGMTEENKNKIFRTDTLHSTYGTMDEKGSGLGLLLCKEFVEKQGGSISFETKEGIGTTFTFSLPIDYED